LRKYWDLPWKGQKGQAGNGPARKKPGKPRALSDSTKNKGWGKKKLDCEDGAKAGKTTAPRVTHAQVFFFLGKLGGEKNALGPGEFCNHRLRAGRVRAGSFKAQLTGPRAPVTGFEMNSKGPSHPHLCSNSPAR